jgi:glycosyltransferase involved in cell wall biosynthesis
VIPTYLPAVRYGGPIFATHSLCRALVSRGHDIEVFTTNLDGAGHSPVSVGAPTLMDGVRVRYFSSPFLKRLSWAPSMGHAFRREIVEFDLVHLHSVFLWPTWAAARAAEKVRIPYLVSPRGMLVRKLLDQRSRLVKSVWISLIGKRNVEHASAVHVTSDLEAVELRSFAWRFPRIATIPNGVDESEYYARNAVSADVAELTAEHPLILFLGRMSWKKGLDRLLEAFARTNTGKLAVVGPDDENLMPRLNQLARDLQIIDRVRFLPRAVLGCDKEHLYRAAQVFVLPSYSENFGNTVLEAMRRSVPVVVTPEVGAAEIVRRSGGGIVARGESKCLAAAIQRLLKRPDIARSMGQLGRRHTMEHYGWNTIAARMEDLYATILTKHPV